MQHAGIVLAAGASTRMGEAKALLETKSGIPLAAHQANQLSDAGCKLVVVVLGAEYERISPALLHLSLVHHVGWEAGRLSSVIAGLRACPNVGGYVILPVDTAGMRATTLAQLIAQAEEAPADAWRPIYKGEAGRVVWLSGPMARRLMKADVKPDQPLDQILASVEQRIDVDDPAVTNNVNTPEEWAATRAVYDL